ncbi:MAG: phosphoribosylanthranilate isomerase [Acidobacteria bacterium]|nr:phosphoribosylanthranilate isomerase [Acidobacteriota bacterium]
MVKVKICGITNLEDALTAAKFGADALGFNFYRKSPRFIEPEKARLIIDELPPAILKVGVFVNEDFERIVETAAIARLDAIQLHGEETPEFAKRLKEKKGLEIIKAFRVSPDFRPEDVLAYEVDAILLDAYNPKEHGGTGETFDWRIARKVKELFPKIYLAGGLKLENVAWSIDGFFPYYVDVCSGVEQEKGKKDAVKTINFIRIAKYESRKPVENIYDYFWAQHPNLGGFRYCSDKLSLLVDRLTSFEGGMVYGASKSGGYDPETFFLKFRRKRIDPVTGEIDRTLPAKHLSFGEFIRKRYEERPRAADWSSIIIANSGKDDLNALYRFYALLEEYRIDYEEL